VGARTGASRVGAAGRAMCGPGVPRRVTVSGSQNPAVSGPEPAFGRIVVGG
jgi:hypothetical protein